MVWLNVKNLKKVFQFIFKTKTKLQKFELLPINKVASIKKREKTMSTLSFKRKIYFKQFL